MIGLKVTSKVKGVLRKKMDKAGEKIIRLPAFEAFMLGVEVSARPASVIAPAELTKLNTAVATLPVEIPPLPDNYSPRPNIEGQIVDLLIGKAPCNQTILAHGMGGVGKSCIKAKVIRDRRVRQRFEVIAWYMKSFTE